jgi:hypothetical protein
MVQVPHDRADADIASDETSEGCMDQSVSPHMETS